LTEHWDGAAWLPVSTPSSTANLVGVWGVDATHVWAIAEDGAMVAWDGSQWTTAPALGGNTGSLPGCSATEIWTGAGSTGGPSVGRFDGATWHGAITGATTFSSSGRVWCAAPGDTWLLTADAVLHRSVTP
jgi:hypothetical protein